MRCWAYIGSGSFPQRPEEREEENGRAMTECITGSCTESIQAKDMVSSRFCLKNCTVRVER